MNCNTTHYRANSSSVPGDPTPIAVCDVERCADAIAWCVRHFDEAPPIVNLFDPAITSRADLLVALRARGWSGRVVWVPISVLAAGMTMARTALSLVRGRWPKALHAWSILRPRRYDTRVAASLLAAVRRDADALPSLGLPVPAPPRHERRPAPAAGARASTTP